MVFGNCHPIFFHPNTVYRHKSGNVDLPLRWGRGVIRAHQGNDGDYHRQGRALLRACRIGLQNEARCQHDHGNHDEQFGERCEDPALGQLEGTVPVA